MTDECLPNFDEALHHIGNSVMAVVSPLYLIG